MRNTAAVFAIAVNVSDLFCRFAADYRCHKERVANQRERTISFAHTADWLISEDQSLSCAAAAAAAAVGRWRETRWVIILLH